MKKTALGGPDDDGPIHSSTDPSGNETSGDTEDAAKVDAGIEAAGAGGGIDQALEANRAANTAVTEQIESGQLRVAIEGNAATQAANVLAGNSQYDSVPRPQYDDPDLMQPDGNYIQLTLIPKRGADPSAAALPLPAAHFYEQQYIPVRRSAGTGSLPSSVSAEANRAAQAAQYRSTLNQEANPDQPGQPGYPSCLTRNCCLLTLGLVGVTAAGGSLLYFYLNSAASAGQTNQATTPAADPPKPASPPPPPTGLTAEVQGPTEILLSWVPVLGIQYVVKRNGVVLATLAAGQGSYTDTGLTALTSYSYTVAAMNAAGTSADSAPVSATTSSAPLQAPPAPTGIFAVAFDTQTIRLSWLNATGADSYTIKRRLALDSTYTVIAANYVPPSRTLRLFYDDTTAAMNTQYAYTISASNVSGTSADSPFVSVNSMNDCDVLMSNAVTAWNQLADATYWEQLKTWVQLSTPSFDCQFNVVNFSRTIADMSAPFVFSTEALIQAQVDALLAAYHNGGKNTLTLYNGIAALSGPNAVSVPRYEKLNILSRVIANIIAPEHKKK